MMRKLILLFIFIFSQSLIADTLPNATPSPKIAIIDDVKLNKILKHRIRTYNPAGLDIEVHTHNGIASLVGDLNTTNEAMTLIEIAEATKGIINVDAEKLTVLFNHLSADAIFSAKIKGTLIKNKIFEDSIPFDVTTKQGIVYLINGAVTQDQLNNVMKVIKAMQGVKNVVSELKKVAPANPNS